MRVFFLTLVIAVFSLPAAALPDFTIDGPLTLDAAPKGPQGSMRRLGPGQEIYVTGKVTNQGNARATDIVIELRVSGKIINRQTLQSLRAGASEPFVIEWLPEGEGSYEIDVLVDPTNRIVEAVESDNQASLSFALVFNTRSAAGDTSALPDPEVAADLEIRGGIMISPPPSAGAISKISFDVHNAGDAVAESVEVEVRVGGTPVQTVVIPSVAPDHRKSASASWKAGRGGSSTVEIVIDPRNLLREKNKANNSEQKSIEIKRR